MKYSDIKIPESKATGISQRGQRTVNKYSKATTWPKKSISQCERISSSCSANGTAMLFMVMVKV